MFRKKDESKKFFADFVAGAMSGATTGAIVALPEYYKVVFQANRDMTWKRAVSPAFIATETPNLLRTVPSFATTFASVCALELSVNARIGENYGEKAGVFASAVTGATFLTAADHFMLRRHISQQSARVVLQQLAATPTKVFTGFTPMFFREAMFVANVAILGPNFGKSLQDKYGSHQPSKREQNMWTFAGTVASGIVTTAFSQPFDSLTRQMQMSYKENPSNPLRIPSLLQKMYREGLFYRGGGPRLVLASTGAALVVHFYKKYRDGLTASNPTLFPPRPVKATEHAVENTQPQQGPKAS